MSESDLAMAVSLALNPNSDPDMKAKAIAYCDQVKSSPDSWIACLQLFVKNDNR